MSEAISARRVFEALLRQDFHAFVLWAFTVVNQGQQLKDNWHIKLMTSYLEDAFHGRRRRVLICLPPRHLKSFICSVCFPAWVLGNDPSAKLVGVSYAQPLAEGFAHQTRMLMDSAKYKRVFPLTRIDPKRSSKRDIGTTRNGHRLATSITGALTGMGGDFLIIDDPIKADDALSETVRESVNNWYVSTATSRLDDPKRGRIITVAQRLHVDDLPGRLIAAGGWDELTLPLIAHEQSVFSFGDKNLVREPGNLLHEDHLGHDEVAHLRKTMPSSLFEAQWNQRPVMSGGNIFKAEWLRYVEEPLELREFDAIVQSWDTAVMIEERNDFTVCVTVGLRGKEIHILDVYRDRIDHPMQLKKIVELRSKWMANLVVLEASHGGLALYQHLSSAGPPYWLVTSTPKAPKNERAEYQSAKFEHGRVFLPRHAVWRSSFEAELAAFPKGHDDQVDAMSQVLAQVDSADLKRALHRAERMAA